MNRIIIDVREPAEYAGGHVEGAINLPLSDLVKGKVPDSLPKDADIILYCRSGGRAQHAMHYLRSQGYKNLTNGINQAALES